MSQSRKHSLFESFINVFIGWFVAMVSQLVIFPLVDIHVGIKTNFQISIFFTVVSILRSYVIRRYFNSIIRGNLK